MRLKTILIAAVVATPLVLCPPVYSGQAAPPPTDLWKMVHPGAKFIIGVDWQRAKASPVGRMVAKQFAGQAGKFKSSGPALDMIDQLDRVLISGTQASAGAADPMAGAVVAIEGRLDRALLKKTLPTGTAVERFRGVDLYVPPKSRVNEPLLAILSDRNALLADRNTMALILDGQSGAQDAALAQRALEMSAKCEIWMVAASLAKPAADGAEPALRQLEDIESMDFGLNLQQGLGLRANLIAKTPESAQGFAMMAQLFSSMATQDQKQAPEIAEILRSIKVTTEGNAVRMSLDIPTAQLEKGVASARSSFERNGRRTIESFLGVQPSGQVPPGLKPAVKGVTGPTATQAAIYPAPPREPELPKTRTIRIVGAEGGPKEITYTSGGKTN
ncbi:MAG: hypothetical protein HY821_19915 [Acidobacteria bacterium]|nr:hypothetical protein [Acidobacteriota bacterium]